MTAREATEAIWQSIPGAGPLHEIYGYWPTLHDAVVRAMHFGFAERELSIVFDYNDLAGDEEHEEGVSTQITMHWHGISASSLRFYSENLYGMEFALSDEGIETRFEEYSWGMDGFVRSQGVEVTHIEPLGNRSDSDKENAAEQGVRIVMQ